MRVVKKEKRFPLSLFVEIAKRIGHSQWKIADRVGYPGEKLQ